MKKLALCLLALVAAGCGDRRYEIVASSSDTCNAYRLDTRTGDVACITGMYLYPVAEIKAPK